MARRTAALRPRRTACSTTPTLREPELVDAILCWSAIPGGSRHHWGSDLDVIDAAAMPQGYQVQLVPEEYAADGVFARLTSWLDANMHRYGYFRPYASDRGGAAVEPWHLSYAPVAALALEELSLPVLRACTRRSGCARQGARARAAARDLHAVHPGGRSPRSAGDRAGCRAPRLSGLARARIAYARTAGSGPAGDASPCEKFTAPNRSSRSRTCATCCRRPASRASCATTGSGRWPARSRSSSAGLSSGSVAPAMRCAARGLITLALGAAAMKDRRGPAASVASCVEPQFAECWRCAGGQEPASARVQPLIIERRFNGPPDSGNGGYVCGLLATAVDREVKVRLRVPPPLETPLTVEPDTAGGWSLRAGATDVATATPARLEIDVPSPPPYVQSVWASQHYAGFRDHVFPGLLRLRTRTAAWRRAADLSRACSRRASSRRRGCRRTTSMQATARSRAIFHWAALDCPGYFAVAGRNQLMLLGEMHAHVDRRVHVGESVHASSAGSSARTAASTRPARRSSTRTAIFARGRARPGSSSTRRRR